MSSRPDTPVGMREGSVNAGILGYGHPFQWCCLARQSEFIAHR
jgi:hypothetical protein